VLVVAGATLVAEDFGSEDAALLATLSLVLVFSGSVAVVVTRAIRGGWRPAEPPG
jgi:hypothetical protein